MHRISSDKDYYADGKVVIDADGIPLEPASKDYVDQRVPVSSFTGTGSPEGKVAAPVGSAYTDTAATNGAIRWIKTSGTSTTGWRVEYGDTGWRNLSGSSVAPGWSGGFYVRRIGNTVHIRMHQFAADETATVAIVDIPTGFRADNIGAAVGRYLLHEANQNSTVWRISFAASLLSLSKVPSSTTRLYGDVSWHTSDAWPTPLPGTPA